MNEQKVISNSVTTQNPPADNRFKKPAVDSARLDYEFEKRYNKMFYSHDRGKRGKRHGKRFGGV